MLMVISPAKTLDYDTPPPPNALPNRNISTTRKCSSNSFAPCRPYRSAS